MDKVKYAQQIFSANCNCAQATLVGLASDKIDEKSLLLLSSAFGGGIAQQGKTCGVVTGALMALGLEFGYISVDSAQSKADLYSKANRFINEFKERNGSDNCNDLTGYDITCPKEKKLAAEQGVFKRKCPLLVASAIEIMQNVLAEPKE